MRLINRQDAIDTINAVDNYGDGIAFEVLGHASRDVALLPIVEAEPIKHGHYIKGDNGEWFCSECRRIDDKYGVAKYCWNCGAKMDGGE